MKKSLLILLTIASMASIGCNSERTPMANVIEMDAGKKLVTADIWHGSLTIISKDMSDESKPETYQINTYIANSRTGTIDKRPVFWRIIEKK